MYRFLPYNCRQLYKMRLEPARCGCGSGCSDCYGTVTCGCSECCQPEKRGRKRRKHLRQEKYASEEELVTWEEAGLVPGLADLFVNIKLLNVVFEWDGPEARGKAVSLAPRVAFEVMEIKGAMRVFPLGEETQPMPLMLPCQNGTIARHDKGRLQKANISLPPKTAFDMSLSFAFQVTVHLETAADLESVTLEKPQQHDYSLNRRIRVTKTEAREECNVRMKTAKHPRYFCRSCCADICKECLTQHCNCHNVQWIGNQAFTCSSPLHRCSSALS